MRFGALINDYTLMKTPRSFALAAVTSLILLTGAATSAMAADELVQPMSSSQCGSGQFCLWSATLYGGTFYGTSTSVDSSPGWTAKAVYNRTSHAVRVYSGASGSGSSTCFAPGASSGAMTLSAGSIRVLSATSC
ncbi:peptidase inhibitor family I36 protein [Cellulomonas sp. P22]|uniref:peptidase inhibitor family I36 protein n=1 Tax=Cellulomonas sp. P22 TaxID=3373189 RepID=UPI0037A436C8